MKMEQYYIESKNEVNEANYPFFSHVQTQQGVGTMVRAHIHEYIEILLALSGSFEIFLTEATFTFEAGDIVIINSNEIHKIIAVGDGENQYVYVKFDPQLLYSTPNSFFEVKYILPFTLNKATHPKIFPAEQIKDTFIPELMREIYSEFTQKNYGFELAIKTLVCKLFLWILRKWHTQQVDLNIGYELNQRSIDYLQLVFEYVEKNYKENLKIDDMAKLCNMSYSYFSHFFNRVMKKSFSEYLNFVRITEAEKLLITTPFTITEIAYEVGFSNTSYFINTFKALKNITPLQYRRSVINV